MNDFLNYYFNHLFRGHIRRCSQVALIGIKRLFGVKDDFYKRMIQLKNSHSGERCLIVGNGPSLRIEDLDFFKEKGIDCFGSNRILDILNKTQWRPKYLCVMDPGFLLSKSRTMTPEEYCELAKKYGIEQKFFVDVLKQFIPCDNAVFCNVLYAPLFSKSLFPFSKNLEYGINDLGSVTHFSIELACYMGYKEIYLYGMDNTYTKYLNNDGKFKVDNSIESHVKGMKKDDSDKKVDVAPNSRSEAFRIGGFADKRKNDVGYSICKKHAKKRGVQIYNITHGGKLDVFERKQIEEI